MTDYSQAGQAPVEVPQNPHFDFIPVRGHRPVIEWTYPEFQSICPLSERHDQGVLTVRYCPKERILESKSMREYLREWRNLRNWQEYVTEEIADALFSSLEPEWLAVTIEWTPRGGIYARTLSRRGDESKIE